MLGVAYYTEPYLLRSELAILQRIDPWIPLLMGPVGLLVYWFIGLLVTCLLVDKTVIGVATCTYIPLDTTRRGRLARSITRSVSR